MFWTLIDTSRHDHLNGKLIGSRRWWTELTCSAIGLNFFSLVFSLARVPELWRSEYLERSVCSSSSDHFLRFIDVLPPAVDRKTVELVTVSLAGVTKIGGGCQKSTSVCERVRVGGEDQMCPNLLDEFKIDKSGPSIFVVFPSLCSNKKSY